ncbi:hypothetical protein SO802_014268, partial [Lithocarpus litseifolius]
SLLTRFQQISVKHVYREGNRCADKLAKDGCISEVDFVVLDQPPSSELCNLLFSDVVGMYSLSCLANTLPTLAY